MLVEAIERPVPVGSLVLHEPFLSRGNRSFRGAIASAFQQQLFLGGAAPAGAGPPGFTGAAAALLIARSWTSASSSLFMSPAKAVRTVAETPRIASAGLVGTVLSTASVFSV